jgi:hypothetical protein
MPNLKKICSFYFHYALRAARLNRDSDIEQHTKLIRLLAAQHSLLGIRYSESSMTCSSSSVVSSRDELVLCRATLQFWYTVRQSRSFETKRLRFSSRV